MEEETFGDISRETDILRKYIGTLEKVLRPSEVINDLFSEYLIPEQVYNEVLSLSNHPTEQFGRIILGLRSILAGNPKALKKFGQVLLKFDSTVPVANDILTEYNEVFGVKVFGAIETEIENEGYTSDNKEAGAEENNSSATSELSTRRVNVSLKYRHDFNQIRRTFALLFYRITKLMEEKNVSIEDLKFYIILSYAEGLKPQLNHATSLKDVMSIVRKECSLLDITLLEGAVDALNITDAIPLIQAYKTETIECCNDITLDLFLNQSLREDSELVCNRIQFVLNWKPDEHSLKDIKNILWKAFDDPSSKVQLSIISEGSVIVTCYAPKCLMDVLVMKGQNNAEVLKGCDMTMLTIGHNVIFDMRNDNSYNEKVMMGLLMKENAGLKRQLHAMSKGSFKTEEDIEPVAKCMKFENFETTVTEVKLEEENIEKKSFDDENKAASEIMNQYYETIRKTSTDDRDHEYTTEAYIALLRQLADANRAQRGIELQIESLRSYIKDLEHKTTGSIPRVLYEDTSSDTSSSSKDNVIRFLRTVTLYSPSLSTCKQVLSEKIKDKGVEEIRIFGATPNNVITELVTTLNSPNIKTLIILYTSLPMSTLALSLTTNEVMKHLVKLELCFTSLTSHDVFLLCSSLANHLTLQELKLPGNTIDNDGARHINLLLTLNTVLETLDLGYCSITDEVVSILSKSLKINQTLKELNLHCNFITSQGAITLSDVLLVTTNLRNVNLNNNKHINTDGANAICTALTKKP